MNNLTNNRRDFLKTSALLAATVATPFTANASQTVRPYTLSCRDAHLREADAPSVWEAAKKIGAGGIEVWVNDDRTLPDLFDGDKTYTINSEEGVNQLAEDAAANGIHITAFAMPNRFDERPEFELEWTTEVVAVSELLNVPAIRIDVVPRKLQGEEFLKFSIEMGKKICDLVDGTPIKYGIENHGNTSNDPVFLETLFDGVGNEALGLTLDTANFYWYGHPLSDLYPIFKKFAPRTYHTHCKSINYPEDQQNIKRDMGWQYGKYSSPIYDGDIDFTKVVGLLKQAGYQNDLCIENEALGKFPKNERGNVLTQEIKHLKEIIA